jgi:FKBP12-rapamycin complex-associated protein
MGEWDQMAEYVSRLDDGDETKLRTAGNNASSSDGSSSGTFFRAVLSVRRGKVFKFVDEIYFSCFLFLFPILHTE